MPCRAAFQESKGIACPGDDLARSYCRLTSASYSSEDACEKKGRGGGRERKQKKKVRENTMLYRNKILGSFAASLSKGKSEPDKNKLCGLPGPGKLCETRADHVGPYET